MRKSSPRPRRPIPPWGCQAAEAGWLLGIGGHYSRPLSIQWPDPAPTRQIPEKIIEVLSVVLLLSRGALTSIAQWLSGRLLIWYQHCFSAWVKAPPIQPQLAIGEAEVLRREASAEGSEEQSREPTNRNWIEAQVSDGLAYGSEVQICHGA
jgi:hypothetical protein